jgi:hypothetical protein
LLDAEEHFYSTIGMVKQMSGRWPEMIVVGITNTNRNQDLTPTSQNSEHSINVNSGGGANFMNFIENELKKYNLTISGDSIRIELIDPSHLGKLLDLLSSAGILPSSITTKR